MTIRDLLEAGIELQGHIIVKEYEEENENTIVLSDDENGTIEEEALDMEITHIYPEDKATVFEVKSEE